MKKIFFLIFLLFLIFCVCSVASEIKRISLSELLTKADLVVMGEVTDVAKEEDKDHVTIQVDSYLKGSSNKNMYAFTLITRGGLKDFDPTLKNGDTGVFFLKLKEQNDDVQKAYWGSIAIFQKKHFYATDSESGLFEGIDLYTSLDKWRAYRVQCNQIRNIEDYERGFRKGFDGPPGLVDGSADFNLGHSDGMLSKMKRFPNQQDAGDCK